MLTKKQIKARKGKLTASRVACLMTGDKDEIYNLWREMVGDPDYIVEDLSGVWPVQFGIATEPINLDWYGRIWGPVSRQGEVVVGDPDWLACTLDGWDDSRSIPIECKTCGDWQDIDVIVARYLPQVTWQMLCTKTHKAALSVILGGREPRVEFIDIDHQYAGELFKRASVFMDCVRNLREPVGFPKLEPPAPATVVYDMTGNNTWADHAANWLQHKAGHLLYEMANRDLKGLVPSDAGRCHGHGIEIKRAKSGALTVRAAK